MVSVKFLLLATFGLLALSAGAGAVCGFIAKKPRITEASAHAFALVATMFVATAIRF